MAFEVCQRKGCARPSEQVVVIIVVSLTQGGPIPPTQLALCSDHGHEVVFLASYVGPT